MLQSQASKWNCLFGSDFSNLFIYFCLRRVFLGVQAFVAALGLSLAGVSRGNSLVVVCGHCSGFFCGRVQAPGRVRFSSSSTCIRSVVAVHRLSCPLACRISLDQGSNQTHVPRVGRQTPDHRGSPKLSELEFQPFHSLTRSPLASYLMVLHFGFLTYKMGIERKTS